MYREHHAVPARIGSDDAQRQRLLEQADAAIGLRQQRRWIDEGALDAARRDFLGEDRRTRSPCAATAGNARRSPSRR